MSATVRFLSIELENFKNIRYGKISFPKVTGEKQFGNNIVGVYGQNGSGKTAMVQAFSTIQHLLNQNELANNLIFHNAQTARIALEFAINDEIPYHATYELEISLNENKQAKLKKEVFAYRPIVKRKKTVQIIYNAFGQELADMLRMINKNGDNVPFNHLTEGEAFEVKLAQRSGHLLLLSFNNHFLGNRDPVGFRILSALTRKLYQHTIVMTSDGNHHLYDDKLLPMTIYFSDKTAKNVLGGIFSLPYAHEPRVMDEFLFSLSQYTFRQINVILPQLIPDLTVELKEIGKSTMPDGSDGIMAELLSIRNGKKIPLYYESTGIKKIISMLSALIAVFNRDNVLVIIDELDAGIFEFLLGEILQVLNKNIAGQLLFTQLSQLKISSEELF